MTTARSHLSLTILTVVLLAGCAPTTRVVLLPERDGRASAVTITTQKKQQVLLDAPYAISEMRWGGDPSVDRTDAETVQRTYADIFHLTPPPAETYTLEFLSGEAILTPESQAQLETILSAALSRSGGEIIIIGHTDTTGTPDGNDKLSQERAEVFRSLLIERGFPAERIQAIGRGQRQLLVPTGPGVDEPRNRRVEITVR